MRAHLGGGGEFGQGGKKGAGRARKKGEKNGRVGERAL